MEEELNYITVTFKTKGISAPEKEKKAPGSWLHLVAAVLGIICVILLSTFITVSIHFNTVMSYQYSEKDNLTEQNLQLRTGMMDLEKRREELTREIDKLNWTLGVIMEHQEFAVNTRCPNKACKPCLEGWVLFQSNCYLFTSHIYSSSWKSWYDSRSDCQNMHADLVVIESLEEQEFINNHIQYYNDEKHGFWIGLSKMDIWTWVDGRNLTVTFWSPQPPNNRMNCVLTQKQAVNWRKAGCTMKNRWICETRALVKQD
ncbi:CD209 antigen-like isoform X2 [Eleginops maclovinus]|uniref:CD209 antigen-like isoform X2 n=1 Tax=Eleginops maclovinus TaxID=56733 RepID=UPI003080EA7E